MRHFFISVFILFSLGLHAQQTRSYSNTNLETVLKDIERLYNVRFSYNAGKS